MVKPPDKDIVRGLDEGNVARLRLFSVQERIPTSFSEWEDEIVTDDGRPGKISCRAGAGLGVPHGLDNDLWLALVLIYKHSGAPPDGVFVVEAPKILALMGWANNGHYHRRLKETLERLSATTYTASQAWRRSDRWHTATFRLIDRIEASGPQANEVDEGSVIKITLGKEVVDSIRKNYIKTLDFELVISFKSPITRALYRTLEIERQPIETQKPVPFFRVGLMEWGKTCKIFSDEPDKIRRTLEPAHKELRERGFLENVEIEGRGTKQILIYRFGKQVTTLADTRTVELLTTQGLGLDAAQRYARDYPFEHVAQRVAVYKAVLERGYVPSNPPGFLVDILRDNKGKYSNIETFLESVAKGKSGTQRKQEEHNAQEELRLLRQEFVGMSDIGKVSKLMTGLGFFFRKEWSARDFDLLQLKLKSGEIDLVAFYDQVATITPDNKARFSADVHRLILEQE